MTRPDDVRTCVSFTFHVHYLFMYYILYLVRVPVHLCLCCKRSSLSSSGSISGVRFVLLFDQPFAFPLDLSAWFPLKHEKILMVTALFWSRASESS